MARSEDSFVRWRGLVWEARTHLYQGQVSAALSRFADSAEAYAEPEGHTASNHAWAARVLLHEGEPVRALEEARLAQEQAPGQWPELEGMFLAALAQQTLGRPAEADRLAADLGGRAADHPNAVEQRQLHLLAGRLALARGETRRAVEQLRAAVALLTPRGIAWHSYVLPDHVPSWFALAEAELAAGREREALRWFRRIVDSGIERVERPILYVQSFERLATIHEGLGELEEAAAMARRLHGFRPDAGPAGASLPLQPGGSPR